MKKILRQPVFYLVTAIIIYVAIFFYLSFYKYANFLYNLEDLSIFTNTLYNTTHGNWFWFSTHGGYSYLGDHLELTQLFLVPFFKLFTSALTLLFFQTLLIGLSAWPLYLIAKKFFSHSSHLSPFWQKFVPFFISLIFLANPYLQNINLEEYHQAPFLMFFFLWTFYFYLHQKYKLFWLFFILTLITREDAGLTLGALTLIIAWKNKKNLWATRKWWLYPMIIAGLWFVLAMTLIKHFNPEEDYKYFLLYGNLFNPLTWVAKIFNTKIIFLFLGLLLPFLFLPLLRPRYLFLALPTFLQVALLNSDGISVVFSTHYQTFFLIPIFLTLIQTISDYNFKQKNLPLIITIILGSQFFISAYLGPLNFLTNTQKYLQNLENQKDNQKILASIPGEASISAPYRLLPNLSTREKAYVNKLTFLGKKHLSNRDFNLPIDTDYLLVDSADMIEYYLHFTNRSRFSPMYWGGAERMRNAIKRLALYPTKQSDSLILYSKTGENSSEPFRILDKNATLPANFVSQPQNFGAINLLGYVWLEVENKLQLFFQTTSTISDDYFFRFSFDKINKIYPPAYGLLPTHDWPRDKIIMMGQILPIPTVDNVIKMELLKLQGDIELGPLNDTRLVVDKEKILGQVEIKLDKNR